MSIYSKVLAITAIFMSFAALTACNHTAQGFGQDMQHNGKQIEKSAAPKN